MLSIHRKLATQLSGRSRRINAVAVVVILITGRKNRVAATAMVKVMMLVVGQTRTAIGL